MDDVLGNLRACDYIGRSGQNRGRVPLPGRAAAGELLCGALFMVQAKLFWRVYPATLRFIERRALYCCKLQECFEKIHGICRLRWGSSAVVPFRSSGPARGPPRQPATERRHTWL